MKQLSRVFVAKNELPVVLSEGLKLLEYLHSDNAQGFLLSASFLQSPLAAFSRKDSEEPETPHRIDPIEHLVMGVAGEVAEKAESLWGEKEGSGVTGGLDVLEEAMVAEDYSTSLESAEFVGCSAVC